MHTQRLLLALALALPLACSSNDKHDTGGAAGGASSGACPADVHTHEAWSYDGADEQCKALATELGKDAGDAPCMGNMGMLTLSEAGGVCRATAVEDCDGAHIESTCTISKSGDGDCSVVVKSSMLDAGSCMLKLTAR